MADPEVKKMYFLFKLADFFFIWQTQIKKVIYNKVHSIPHAQYLRYLHMDSLSMYILWFVISSH